MYSYAIIFHFVRLVGSIIFLKYFLIYFDAQNGSHLGGHMRGHSTFWGSNVPQAPPLGDATGLMVWHVVLTVHDKHDFIVSYLLVNFIFEYIL